MARAMQILLPFILVKPVDHATTCPALDETCHVNGSTDHKCFDSRIHRVHDTSKWVLHLTVCACVVCGSILRKGVRRDACIVTKPTSHISGQRVTNSPCPNHKLPHVIVLEYGSVVGETLWWIVWPRERGGGDVVGVSPTIHVLSRTSSRVIRDRRTPSTPRMPRKRRPKFGSVTRGIEDDAMHGLKRSSFELNSLQGRGDDVS